MTHTFLDARCPRCAKLRAADAMRELQRLGQEFDAAQGIEARSDTTTEIGVAEGESPVAKPCAQKAQQ